MKIDGGWHMTSSLPNYTIYNYQNLYNLRLFIRKDKIRVYLLRLDVHGMCPRRQSLDRGGSSCLRRTTPYKVPN